MTTYYARKEYNYSGGDAIFGIPFDYIRKEHISVSINGEATENYTYLNNSQIRITDTLTVGDVVTIARTTPISSKMVVFSDTSILNKDTQNLAQDQVFDAVQEIYDNNIVFEADVDEQFTDYKSTVDSALNTIDGKADTAISTANGAVNTANSANSKADNAVSTANSANSKADNAVSTANTASSNASTAVNTANTAKNTADTAKETADDTKGRVDEFEEDIEVVIEAAEKIDELEEAVQTAVDAAQTASDKADLASDKADDAIAAADRAEAVIPSQTGHNGQFLKTNGTNTSWETVDALPSQTGKNGKFLKTDGTDAFWEDIPSVEIDGVTITKNTSDKLQTVGVIDQNNTSTAIKTWTGTKAQYDAIVTKDANTLYNITDDTDVTLSLLELIYPVGSIYIGTMNICPLATLGVGTWQLVAADRVLQGAGTRGSVGSTVNESLPNIKGTFSAPGISAPDALASGAITSRAGSTYGNGTGSSRMAVNSFDASRSSSTYQDNAPVQQDAYLVNIWERIS